MGDYGRGLEGAIVAVSLKAFLMFGKHFRHKISDREFLETLIGLHANNFPSPFLRVALESSKVVRTVNESAGLKESTPAVCAVVLLMEMSKPYSVVEVRFSG